MTAEMYHEYFKEYQNDLDLYVDKSAYVAYVYDEEKVNRYIQKQIDLKKKNQPNRIDQLQFQMENGLILQGATAIEDSLQEGVPETLSQLANAGIHIWMITGDKVGTAKNIAVACNLLRLPEMKLIEFTKEAIDANLLSKGGKVEEMTDSISS